MAPNLGSTWATGSRRPSLAALGTSKSRGWFVFQCPAQRTYWFGSIHRSQSGARVNMTVRDQAHTVGNAREPARCLREPRTIAAHVQIKVTDKHVDSGATFTICESNRTSGFVGGTPRNEPTPGPFCRERKRTRSLTERTQGGPVPRCCHPLRVVFRVPRGGRTPCTNAGQLGTSQPPMSRRCVEHLLSDKRDGSKLHSTNHSHLLWRWQRKWRFPNSGTDGPQMLTVGGGKMQGKCRSNDRETTIGTRRGAMQQHSK